MLPKRGNLRVGGLNGSASVRDLAYFGCVALQRAVDKSRCHTLDIICSFGIGERLVRYGLLEAFNVGQLS